MSNGLTEMAYTYDPDGLRIRSVKNGTTTINHLLDKVLPYAQIVQESSGTGTELASYVHGSGLVSMKRPETGMRYYSLDGHGSVRELTDSTGAATDTYDYDAFGNLVASTGTTTNDHRYAGEQYDAQSWDV